MKGGEKQKRERKEQRKKKKVPSKGEPLLVEKTKLEWRARDLCGLARRRAAPLCFWQGGGRRAGFGGGGEEPTSGGGGFFWATGARDSAPRHLFDLSLKTLFFGRV